MDINTLEAFLTLADNLNFTKSAEYLYISQPAFSRKITRLEEEFGCKLFMRNKRTVELTEYGRVFYGHAQDIYAAYTKWTLDLKQMKSKKAGRLRIGYLQDLPHRMFPRAVKKFQLEFDHVELSFKDCSMTDIINRLLSNEIDIGFSLTGDYIEHEKISHASLLAIPFCVALPEGHALASHSTLNIKDLQNENFIMNNVDGYGPASRHVTNMCNLAGFEPNIAAITTLVPSMLILVKSGIGIAIVADTARFIAPEGIRFIHLDKNEVLPTELMLLWKSSNNNPAIPAFVETCKSLAPEIAAESDFDLAL